MGRRSRHLNFANVMSIVAIIGATAGTAAAAVFTGANIKDFSLTSVKIKNGSIELKDISKGGVDGLKGPKGVTGDQGIKGLKGLTGPQGDKGDTGKNANATSSWAYRESAALVDWADEFATPNSGPDDWDAAGFGTANGIPALASAFPGAYASDVPGFQGYNHLNFIMNGVTSPVVALSGMPVKTALETRATGGTIDFTYTANLSATAQLSFLHRNNGENDNDGDGVTYHNRLECQMAYGNGDLTNSTNTMGIPVYVSSDKSHEIVNFTIVGNATNVQQGDYNVAVRCVDADLNSSAHWQFISGNLSVLAAEQ